MIWDRERYIAHCNFEFTGREMFCELFGPLIGLEEEWQRQGASAKEIALTAFDWDYVLKAPLAGNCEAITGLTPRVLEETPEFTVSVDEMGRKTKLCRQSATIPLPMEYPVKTMDDWLKVKHWYEFSEERIDREALLHQKELRDKGYLTIQWVPGGFDEPRQLMGEEELCIACYEEPELIADMLETIGNTCVKVMERVAEIVPIHEDMAGKPGPLFGPAQIEAFLQPYYQKIWNCARAHGAKIFSQDSDGNMNVTIKKGSEILTEVPMNAGTYTVEVHTEAGKNYEAGNQTFSFEIKKAPLSVKAVDQNVTVGDAIPEYKVLYEGFAGTDTADVLNGSLKFTCEYAPDSAAGDYSILPSGLTSENYEIHFENGTLHAVRRASSGSDDSDNSGSTKNPAATNFGKNVSNSSSSENDAQGTWKRDNKGWWFEFKDGTYPAGEKTSDQNGEKLGWIQKDGKWWAFGSGGYLKRGWAQDNASGKWYLIDENTGMQTSWHYDESDQHWYYLDPASGVMLTGWQFINGKWYYLSKISGAVPLGSMYREIRTPDGYYVDKDGVWDGLETKEK